ncbi:hypothetical protein PILCRDRAFT_14335 [Piloderma croceum F 1598]|uniref:Mid2 domain-containing protein n=1 Tax=Piloderma croceum (strain F 1598) TaxID=765440 RepID=A0A0C3AKX1_PILCF|nr:hypothetical protein PILCRDRAFT_14335 [Piloderma croceum F 1598]
MLATHVLALSLALHLRTSSGFSFTIDNTPQQCSNLNISVIGSGQPPYSAVIVPYGSTPLANNIEVREVLDVAFIGASTSTSFQLNYPENSQFVVVVSDSTGFGTGGASVAVQVQTSSDSSCYNNAKSSSPPFTFSITPVDNQLTQCTSTRIDLYGTTQGSVQFYGVIPGGQCFPINEENIGTGSDAGFDFTVPVRAGVTVLLIGGDSRGIGSGGSEQIVVEQSGSQSCLDSSSPSSTPGSPAGQIVYPTSSSGGGSAVNNNGGNGSSTNGTSSKSNKDVDKDAIIGGAAGGGLIIIAINVLVCLYFIRRRRRTRYDNPVDRQSNAELLSPGLNQISPFYEPEAFRAPDTATVSSYGRQSYDPRQSTEASTTPSISRTGLNVTPSHGMQSYNSNKSMQTDMTTFLQHSGTPEPGGLGRGSTSSGSSPTPNSSLVPGHLYPINEKSAIPETTILPPAYSNIGNTLPW